MDANKLKEAIKWARSYSDSFAPHRPDHPLVLADAAEAHLATLPRKVKVTRYGVCSPRMMSCLTYSTREEAERIAAANMHMTCVVELTGEYEVQP